MQNLIAWDLDFDLRAGLELAARSLPIAATSEIADRLPGLYRRALAQLSD